MNFQRYPQEAIEALRATASPDTSVRERAQKAFAGELNMPLRQGVFDRDNLGGIFEKQVLAPGAQANYPLDFVKPGEEDRVACRNVTLKATSCGCRRLTSVTPLTGL